MQKLTASACLIALAAMFAGGCQKQQQTVGLDEPVPLPQEQATHSETPDRGASALLPWNWFKSDEPKPITSDDVLSDMSPELASRGKTQGELDIGYHRGLDTNLRTADDQILRTFFFDGPLRLSLYPTP